MRTAAADHLAGGSPAATQLRDYLAQVAPQVDSVRLGHASAHWQAVTGELARRGLASTGAG